MNLAAALEEETGRTVTATRRFGGEQGFERVLDLVEAAARGLLDELRASGRA